MPVATADPIEMHRVFDTLKPILAEHENELIVVDDAPGRYYLNTHSFTKNRQRLFFGAVEIKKSYVSFHLFPVYMFPELLEGTGDLKKRMQGKSCFNFKRIDDAQLGELRSLVQAGYDRFRQEGLIA